ncbi:MAG: CRTAC1 family protein [Planctomycetaceae bacterium]|nr:CRTAC1 family protein [Planctomycetaceae bacterium]
MHDVLVTLVRHCRPFAVLGTALVIGWLAFGVWGCHPQGKEQTPKTPPLSKRDPMPDGRVSERSEAQPLVGDGAHFRTVGAESGFDFERFDNISGQRRILETNGGGVALLDADRDGRLDAFLTNGCQLPRISKDQRTPSILLRNLGEMTFREVSGDASLHQFGYAYGCTSGDINSDGFPDLYVTQLGANSLWLNNGDGTFFDASEMVPNPDDRWSSSAAFADVNLDGWLDLYVTNYLDESDDPPTLCPNPASPDGYEGCSPAFFRGVDDVLLLGLGTGAFLDASMPSGVAGHPGKGLGVVIANLDTQGMPEIYVANDGERNFLFHSPKDFRPRQTGTLEGILIPEYQEVAMVGGVALNEQGFAQASMGIAAGDADANGTIDLFLTHFYGDTNTLYANNGDLRFRDITRASGVGPPSRMVLGFGTVFIDDNNDGRLDLFIANGHVDDRTWTRTSEPYHMLPLFLRNDGHGRFHDRSTGSGDYFTKTWIGRGVAQGDLDLDGKTDLVVAHQLAPSVVLRNDLETPNRSIVLHLVGTISNRDGFHTRIEIPGANPSVIRELSGGGSFQSASALEIPLGIGKEESVPVTIVWPSGEVDAYPQVTPGHWVVVEKQSLFPVSD